MQLSNVVKGSVSTPATVEWRMADGEVGEPFVIRPGLRVDVSFRGDFDGGEIRLEGSGDGVTWFPLSDETGERVAARSAVHFTRVRNCPRYVRPIATGAGEMRCQVAIVT